MRTLAIIPARAGSKGIPHKNMAMLNGRPLIGWTIEAAKKAELVDHIIVSTNDEEVIKYANEVWGVRSYLRPEELCQDDSPTEGAIGHTLDTWAEHHPELELTHVILMQATSPIRHDGDVDAMILSLNNFKSGSGVSVTAHHGFLFEWATAIGNGRFICINYPDFTRPMRQEMAQWQGNGSMWAFTIEHWNKTHNRLGGKISIYEMAEETAYQIDSPFDLWLVEQIMQRNQKPIGPLVYETCIRQDGTTGPVRRYDLEARWAGSGAMA